MNSAHRSSLPASPRLPTLMIGVALSLLLTDCARFRIEDLKSSLLFSTKVIHPDVSNVEGRLQAKISGRVPYNFPIKPETDGSRFYFSDPERGLVRVLNSSGDAVKLIGSTQPSTETEAKFVKINVGIPGWIAADRDGNIYIQSRTPPADEPSRKDEESDPSTRQVLQLPKYAPVPSHIIQINDADQLIRKIGMEGSESEPFENIVRINAVPNALLFVLHTINAKPVLSVYLHGTLHYRLANFDPSDANEKRNMHIEIENIVPFPNGESAIASITYHKKNNYEFQYRKVYRVELATGQYEEIAWLDDPDDFFAWIHPDGGFYMQNSDADGMRILYKIYSPSGEYLNNRQINLFGLRSGWREVFMTIDGKIFASRLSRDMFEFYEWQ